MGKRTLFAIISASFSIASYATEYKYNYYNYIEFYSIHKVTLQHNSGNCASIYISTMAGYLKSDNTCDYQEETDRIKNPYSICSTESVKLDGNSLSEAVKPGYNCAATHVSGSLLDFGLDEYKIFSEGGKYTRTEPMEGYIIIP